MFGVDMFGPMSATALLSVMGVLGALLALNLGLRRWAGPGGWAARAGLPGVKVLGRTALGPGQALWLLEVADGRRLLVGAGRDGLRTLAWLPPEPILSTPDPILAAPGSILTASDLTPTPTADDHPGTSS